MDRFLQFVSELVPNFPIHVELNYSKIMDWTMVITKNGCAEYYPNAKIINDTDVLIVHEQDSDLSLLLAKSEVALKKWLLEFRRGY